MKQKHQSLAFLIAGAASLAVFGAVFFVIAQNLRLERAGAPEETRQQAGLKSPTLSRDAVATLGQNFVKTMTSYDPEQEQPVILQSAESKDNTVWTAKYEVEQQEAGTTQIYFYTIEIVDGRIVRSHVALSDRSRSILISSPEPHTIIERGQLVVKGQVFGGQSELHLRLLGSGDEVLLEREIVVQEAEGNPYSESIDLMSFAPGEYTLEMSDESGIVRSTFILSAK